MVILAVPVFLVPFHAGPAFAKEDYGIISQKNLFHPQRKEFKKPAKKNQRKNPVRKRPRQKYWPQLRGTILAGDEPIAIIRFRPLTKSGKRTRLGRWRQGIFYVGDGVGAFTLSGIEKDHIVLDFYGEHIVRYIQ